MITRALILAAGKGVTIGEPGVPNCLAPVGGRPLLDRTLALLDAVGIRNGCGHAEIMLTADGPRLIEVAARPAGGGHQMISKLATGDNHIERTVRHRVFGDFKPGFELIQYLSGVFISSPAEGVWQNAELFDCVESLATFHAKHFPAGTGDLVPATDDIFTFLAWVILAGPDKAALDADYARLKELERQIRIAPATPASRIIGS